MAILQGKPDMPETPTFGRHAEIPYDEMTPEQQQGYRVLIETGGPLGGPRKIWVHNPKLAKATGPLGAHFYPGGYSLSEREREREIAVIITNSKWHSAYSINAHERRGKEVGLPTDKAMLGVPAEAPLHAADEGRGQHAVARGIAVFLVSRQARQRGGDRGRDAEVHVRDPRRQNVGRKLVPLVSAPRPQPGDVEVGCFGRSHASSLHCGGPWGGEDPRTYRPAATPAHIRNAIVEDHSLTVIRAAPKIVPA
jgi:hypothetical protein